MLALKTSAGVAPEVNLRNLVHAGDKACKPRIHPDFETQGRHHQKSKTGVSVAPQNRTDVFPNFLSTLLCSKQVSQFLRTLESDLTQGVGGRLDSVLGQCMYFGLSFSRVGADFRGLLAPIFQEAVLRGFSEAISETNSRFVYVKA